MLSNDWFAGESESDKGRIITRGRMFAENGNTSGLFRTRVEIQWRYKGETDGMPSADETEVIDRIMNLLTESLERSKIAILTAICLLYTRITSLFGKSKRAIRKTSVLTYTNRCNRRP